MIGYACICGGLLTLLVVSLLELRKVDLELREMDVQEANRRKVAEMIADGSTIIRTTTGPKNWPQRKEKSNILRYAWRKG